MLLSKFDAAKIQANWAIRLLVDFHAPVPAVTLAAAAEEILGKSLVAGVETAQSRLKKTLSNTLGLPENTVSKDHLNFARNLFKHWNHNDDCVDMDVETEAAQYIIRFLVNMISYDQSLPSEAPKFIQWLMQSRSDLITEGFVANWNAAMSDIEWCDS